MFTPHAAAPKLIVASRYEASPVFRINARPAFGLQKAKGKQIKDERQLTLF